MRHLQLKRNALTNIFDSRESAKSFISTTLINSVVDGEPIIARYKNDKDELKILLGYAYIDGNSNQIQLIDTAEIVEDVKGNEYVKDINQKLKEDSNYTEAEADVYNVVHDSENGDLTKELQLTYTPISPLELTVPETIGDIEKGMKAEDLNKTPISKILDDIIFKTIYPNVTNPSASTSFKNGFSNNGIYEIGLAAPVVDNLNYSYTKGRATVNDGVTAPKDYTGDATGVVYQMKYTAGAANTNAGVGASGTSVSGTETLATTIGIGTYAYRSIVSYGEGALLQTSKGATPNPIKTENANNVTNPHPASTITTSYNITINGSLPVFATTGTSYTTTLSKLQLKAWGSWTYQGVQLPDTTPAEPFIIETPRKLSFFKSYNAVSGNYDVDQFSKLAMEEITKEINGVTCPYFRYTWNGGAQGQVKYEIRTY
jgi:hypothetical protein